MKRLILKLRNKIFGVNKIESLLNKNIDVYHHDQSVLSNRLSDVAEKLDSLRESYFPGQMNESFDVRFLARLEAGMSSAKFFNEHLYDKLAVQSDLDLLRACAKNIKPEDLVLEFGVFSGRTINALAEYLPDSKMWGFDSFEGLPETWRNDYTKGTFKVDKLPDVRSNVNLIEGWFDDTLPKFLEQNKGQVGFLHVDCDLYSSTKTVLSLLRDRFKNGSVIVFDEYFNYPGWEQHEYKAFAEFIFETGFDFEYVGCNPRHQQVAVKLII
jgi:predicted O-methyltransferase YrrM